MNQVVGQLAYALGAFAAPLVFLFMLSVGLLFPVGVILTMVNVWKIRRALERLNNTLESGIVPLRR